MSLSQAGVKVVFSGNGKDSGSFVTAHTFCASRNDLGKIPYVACILKLSELLND